MGRCTEDTKEESPIIKDIVKAFTKPQLLAILKGAEKVRPDHLIRETWLKRYLNTFRNMQPRSYVWYPILM